MNDSKFLVFGTEATAKIVSLDSIALVETHNSGYGSRIVLKTFKDGNSEELSVPETIHAVGQLIQKATKQI